MANYTVPRDVDVKTMLSMLLGDGLKVTDSAPPLGADAASLIAVYVSDAGEPVAASVCDAAFAAFAGGALSILPPGGTEAAAKSGELSEVMITNTHELMNICSRLFMNDSTAHLRLDKLYRSLSEAPAETQLLLAKPAKRSDFELDVPRYGSGRLALLAT